MPNLKRIKNQIGAIEKTNQITNAMYSISASKIKKSDLDVLAFADFDREFQTIFKLFAGHYNDYLTNKGTINLYILITSDRGLAGNYHSQLFKFFKQKLSHGQNNYIYPIGRKGYFWAQKEHLSLVTNHVIFNKDNTHLINLKDISLQFKTLFLKGINKIAIIYNQAQGNDFTSCEQIIFPLAFANDNNEQENNYELDTSISLVKEQILDMYLETCIYKSILEAKRCEHYKRMLAMKNASDNAKNIIGKLKIKYHQARQQQITNELIDIISGANN